MNHDAWAAIALESHPFTVWRMHELYIEAGVDVITTNTCSSARHNLLPIGLGDKVHELNLRAVMLAQDARDGRAKERTVWIGGSVSSYGLMAGAEPGWQDFEYFRGRQETSYTQARTNLREQAEILAEAGVDFLIAESTGSTMQRRWVIEECFATVVRLQVPPGLRRRRAQGGQRVRRGLRRRVRLTRRSRRRGRHRVSLAGGRHRSSNRHGQDALERSDLCLPGSGANGLCRRPPQRFRRDQDDPRCVRSAGPALGLAMRTGDRRMLRDRIGVHPSSACRAARTTAGIGIFPPLWRTEHAADRRDPRPARTVAVAVNVRGRELVWIGLRVEDRQERLRSNSLP